ncbi:unnamed protein product [Owenia fusiformis]|uniref:Uncharacterized protein n=1 Tax=Owenia fusiformis TaxID=6347 RepID=A0A8S4NUE0_OWEFU|nr:unnamed protein product [Owenia fusiformis]
MAKAIDQSAIKSSKETNNWNIGHSVKTGNSQNDVGEYVSDNPSNKKKRKRKSKSKSEGMLDRLRGSLKVRSNMLKKVKKSNNLEYQSGNDCLQGDTDTDESQLETLHEDFSLNAPTAPKSFNSTMNTKFNRRPSLAGSRRISMRSVSDSDITSIGEDSVFRPELPFLNRKASIRTTLNKMGYDIKPKKAPAVEKELTNDELEIIDRGIEDFTGLRKQSLNSRMIMRTQLKGGRSKLDPVNKTKAQVLTLETINSADDLESLNKRAKLPNISQQHTMMNQSFESTLQGRLSRQQSVSKEIGTSSTESTFTGRLSRKDSLVRRTSGSSLVSSQGSEDHRYSIGRRSSIIGKDPTGGRRKSVKEVFSHVTAANTITSMMSRRRGSKESQDANNQEGNLLRRRSSVRLANVLGTMNKKRIDRKASVSDGLVGIVQTKHEMARRKRRVRFVLYCYSLYNLDLQ